MDVSIIKKDFNQLLQREEIVAISKPQATYAEAKKMISEQIRKPEELIVIKRINPEFGKQEAKIEAYAYSSEESMKKFEPKPKVKKVPGPTTPAKA